MENLEEILDVDAFYANIDSKEKLLEFCNRLHAKCAKSLGIKPTGVIGADLKDNVSGTVSGVKSSSIRAHITPSMLKVCIANSVLNKFDEARGLKDKKYLYELATTVLHETRHRWQAEPSGKSGVKAAWLYLSDLARQAEKMDLIIGMTADLFKTGGKNVENMSSKQDSIEEWSYLSSIVEMDAREYAALELFKAYQKTKDVSLLGYINDSYAEGEKSVRAEDKVYRHIYDIPEKLEDKGSGKTWKYVRNAIWGKTSREKGVEMSTALIEETFGKEKYKKYKELKSEVKMANLEDIGFIFTVLADEDMRELFEAKRSKEDVMAVHALENKLKTGGLGQDGDILQRWMEISGIMNRREKQVVEELFPHYKTIAREAERVLGKPNDAEISR